MRVYGSGDYLFKGADLGIVVTNARMQTDDPNGLTERCQTIISGLRSQYVTSPIAVAPPVPPTILGASAL